MYYKHNLDYKYPERCDEHMIEVKELRQTVFDEKYPYLRKDFAFKCLRSIYWLGLQTIGFLLVKVTHGLRVYGRENLKAYKEQLRGGAITISNHVFYFDLICVLCGIRPHLVYFPAWKENLNGSNRLWIRMSGGIPIPTGSIRSMIKFKQAMQEVFESDTWMHFYPEGSMWLFYPDIRPFKPAVFKYAVKYDRPIIPLTLSFRPRKGPTKLFTKKPQVDLHVGEPLFYDKSLSPAEAAKDLQARAYHVMQVMNGIQPGDCNYRVDQDPDHYQKTM